MLVTIEVAGRQLRLANFDGETGGNKSEEAAMKTDHIIGALKDELDTQPKIPTFMMGDLNAEPQDIPAVQDLLEEEAWLDCG